MILLNKNIFFALKIVQFGLEDAHANWIQTFEKMQALAADVAKWIGGNKSQRIKIAAGLHFPKSQSHRTDFYPLVFRHRRMELLFGKSETALSPIWSFVMLHVLVRIQKNRRYWRWKKKWTKFITELTHKKISKSVSSISKILYWSNNFFPLRNLLRKSYTIVGMDITGHPSPSRYKGDNLSHFGGRIRRKDFYPSRDVSGEGK